MYTRGLEVVRALKLVNESGGPFLHDRIDEVVYPDTEEGPDTLVDGERLECRIARMTTIFRERQTEKMRQWDLRHGGKK